jgi:hypothetical protein
MMAQELGSFIGVWRTRDGKIAEVKRESPANRTPPYLSGTINGDTCCWGPDGRYYQEGEDDALDLMERLDGKVK